MCIQQNNNAQFPFSATVLAGDGLWVLETVPERNTYATVVALGIPCQTSHQFTSHSL